MADTSSENVYDLLKKDPNRIYVIAEAGLNHGGNKEKALALVRAAKWAGADAVKFQPFRADNMLSIHNAAASVSKDQPDPHGDLKKFELPADTFRALSKEAKRIGIDFLSTPVDERSADVLCDLGVNGFKIGPADIAHRPFIEHVARKAKPVFISTGLTTSDQIETAINWIRCQSNDQTLLLHSVSSFPAKLEELNLKSLQYLRERFGVLVGFSDHSVATLSSLVAASLGAQVIERHFMIESRGDTPDYAVSMDAKTLKTHIEELRKVSTVLGERGKFATPTDVRTTSAVSANQDVVTLKLQRTEKNRAISKARAAHAK